MNSIPIPNTQTQTQTPTPTPSLPLLNSPALGNPISILLVYFPSLNSFNAFSFCRKQLDPETTQYFSEIANLFETEGVELEERSLICANALQETKGKEFEIASDYIVSHTLETILQGCDVDHLCDFLHSSANDFPYIAMDRSGSHVAETAIKSLAVHLQHDEARPLVEEALTVICKVDCISY